MECEYADGDHLVLMLTPQNRPEELHRLIETLGRNERPPKPAEKLLLPKARQEMSIREAMLRPQERVPAEKALGRVCGSPTVAVRRRSLSPYPASESARKRRRCFSVTAWKAWRS